MTLAELRKQPHLSASSINTYVDCGLLYQLSKVDRFRPEFRSDSMEFGSVIHKVVAEFHEYRKNRSPLSLEDLHHIFEGYWEEAAYEQDDIKYSKGKSYESYFNEGKALLTEYYTKFNGDGLRVIAIEDAFSFNLPDIPLPLIGGIDLIEEDDSGTIIISDLKTSGRAYSAVEIDDNDQLTVYNMSALANGFKDREILLRFDVLIKTKTPRFEQYYTVRSDEIMDKMHRKIKRVWDGISKEIFVPNTNNWKCKCCSYKTHCNDWFKEEAA